MARRLWFWDPALGYSATITLRALLRHSVGQGRQLHLPHKPQTRAWEQKGPGAAWGLGSASSAPENSAAVPLSVRSPRSNLPLLRPTKTEAPACLTWLACDVTKRHSLVKATPKGGNALGLTAPEESVSGAGWGRLAASLPMSQASARWVSSPPLFGVGGW